MMRIALISPLGNWVCNNQKFVDFWNTNENMSLYKDLWSGNSTGLLTVAALTPPEHEVEYIDESIRPVDFSEKFDLVGITACTEQASRAYEIAEEFRRRGIKTVMGGIHASVLPEEASQHADTVIVGEAEDLWPEYLNDLAAGNPGQIYRSTRPVDLKKSPLPRFELGREGLHKTVWIQMTRGCPHDCEFCAASRIYGKRYRSKSIPQIIDEIKKVRALAPYARIGFADDNFFVHRRQAKQLLKELIPLKIRWMAQTDIAVSEDDELLDLAFKSGCIQFFIGLESVARDNLKTIDKSGWKYRKFASYGERIKKIQSYGIGVFGAFIIGLDHDEPSIIEQTAEFILANNLFGAQINILVPLPGTRLRDRLKAEDRLVEGDWSHFSPYNVTYKPKKMTALQLMDGVVDIYKMIYSKEAIYNKLLHFKNIYKKLNV